MDTIALDATSDKPNPLTLLTMHVRPFVLGNMIRQNKPAKLSLMNIQTSRMPGS